MSAQSPASLESAYVVRGDTAPDAIITSLRALLPTRQRPLGRTRYTELDTFDGRVRRAGARLTRSGVNGTSTMAWLPPDRISRVTTRVDQPVGFAWDLPSGPLQEAIAPVIGVRRLLPQAEAEESGSLLDILDDRGKTIARVRFESGRVRRPGSRGGWQALPTVITLSGLRGYADAFERLVPVVESRPGLEPCPGGLHAVLLRRIGAAEASHLTGPNPELAPTIRAGEGARQTHVALLGILAINEPGVRARLDTEFLHDFRVALRRTRALLGQIKRVFPARRVEYFAAEFSWLGRLSGEARDMDVLALALRDHRGDIPADDMNVLMAFVGEAQEREYRRLVALLDGDRYRRLGDEWRGFLSRPAASAPEASNADRPLADVIAERAWRLSRRIADTAETIGDRTTAARLHEVRIDAKKLRYLVDVAPGVYDRADLTRILGALKTLQRVLGDFNDAQVQERRLIECGHAMGAAGGPSGALLALGRLAEQCRHRRAGLREPVVEALARFRARDTRSACRRAFKRGSAGSDR